MLIPGNHPNLKRGPNFRAPISLNKNLVNQFVSLGHPKVPNLVREDSSLYLRPLNRNVNLVLCEC